MDPIYLIVAGIMILVIFVRMYFKISSTENLVKTQIKILKQIRDGEKGDEKL